MKNLGFFFKNILRLSLRISLLIVLVLYTRPLTAQVNEDYFDVVYSKSDSWAGGAVGSGSGVNYTFIIKFKKSANLCFDTLWIGNKPTTITNNSFQKLNNSYYYNGDSIVVYAEIYYPVRIVNYYLKRTENITDEKTFNNPLPDYKCEVLLQFIVNDELYYYGVKKFDLITYTAFP